MSGMPRPTFTRSLLAPRHWLAWLGVGAIWLIARLPQRALMWLGRQLGALLLRDSLRATAHRRGATSHCAFPNSMPPHVPRWSMRTCATSA